MTNKRLENIHTLIKYGTQLQITLPGSVLKENTNHESFQQVQKALKQLQEDNELAINRVTTTKYKLNPDTTDTITIRIKQEKTRTPIIPGKNKPRFHQHKNKYTRVYLRLKNPAAIKRIKDNRFYQNRSQYLFPKT